MTARQHSFAAGCDECARIGSVLKCAAACRLPLISSSVASAGSARRSTIRCRRGALMSL